MIDIPPEIQIKSTIKPGSVYYFVEETLSSNEPHYFIVINKNPHSDRIILLVCSSSQIKITKYRRRYLKETLVEITKEQYEGFTRDSIVDCNDVFDKTIDQIILKLKKGELKPKREMDISIVEKLRNAVCKSPSVDPDIIDMLIE